MKINIDIPDAQLSKVIDAFAATYNYHDTITDRTSGTTTPNPQTKAQFAKQCIINYIKQIVRSNDINEATKIISSDDVNIT